MSNVVTDANFPDERQRDLLDDLLSHGILFPPDFKDQIREWILEGMKNLPFTQILGSQLLVGKASGNINPLGTGFNAITSGSYASYTSPIKVLGIPKGTYMVWYGGLMQGAASTDFHNLSINGTPLSDDYAMSENKNTTGEVRMAILDLPLDTNTIEFVGKSPNVPSDGLFTAFIAYMRLAGA